MKHFCSALMSAMALALLMTPGAIPAQAADAPAAAAAVTGPDHLTITGPSGVVTLSLTDLSALPQESVPVTWHGKAMTFSGVLLSDLLAQAGAPRGEALHGAWLASYVVVRAADGYTVVLSLAETNASLHPGRVILALAVDGKPLAPADGPLRLVFEGDQRPVRSARMVAEITLKSAKP